MAELIEEFLEVLDRDGMASMDEFGDMLDWPLPRRDGWSRHFHVFDPGFCSFSDQFRGTIHYHGGSVRGTLLAGSVTHLTYHAAPDPDGDRFLGEQAYTLRAESTTHAMDTRYELPARVPHWVQPRELTVTYFEEEDNGEMGDLLNPADDATDDHVWEQPDAEALLPRLQELLRGRLQALRVTA